MPCVIGKPVVGWALQKTWESIVSDVHSANEGPTFKEYIWLWIHLANWQDETLGKKASASNPVFSVFVLFTVPSEDNMDILYHCSDDP